MSGHAFILQHHACIASRMRCRGQHSTNMLPNIPCMYHTQHSYQGSQVGWRTHRWNCPSVYIGLMSSCHMQAASGAVVDFDDLPIPASYEDDPEWFSQVSALRRGDSPVQSITLL
jgi:hypothetical protein